MDNLNSRPSPASIALLDLMKSRFKCRAFWATPDRVMLIIRLDLLWKRSTFKGSTCKGTRVKRTQETKEHMGQPWGNHCLWNLSEVLEPSGTATMALALWPVWPLECHIAILKVEWPLKPPRTWQAARCAAGVRLLCSIGRELHQC